MLFEPHEYARAEERFIGRAIRALARARGGLFSQLTIEPTESVSTTLTTVDEGTTVEYAPMEVRFKYELSADALIEGRIDAFVDSLDSSAEQYLESLMPQVFEQLTSVTKATGNVVDAAGRPIFDAFYEMLEKVDLSFDEEGRITQSLVMHPDTWASVQAQIADWTPEQNQKLEELIDEKRRQANARRRDRRLPRNS